MMYLFSIVVGLLIAQNQTKEQGLAKVAALWKENRLKEARSVLDKIVLEYPKDYDVLSAVSHTYILQGRSGAQDKKYQAYKEAERFADEAIKLDPKHSLGYLRRAVARANLAEHLGIFEVSWAVNNSCEDAKKAIQLGSDNKEDLALAHYIVGRANLDLSHVAGIIRFPLGLGWGNIEDAIKHLEQAMTLQDGYILASYDYARAMIDMGKREAAKDILKKIDTMKPIGLEDAKFKKQAKELLAEISD